MKLAVFTTTRAEFGILSALLEEINKHVDMSFFLFVGGTHLLPEYGMTIKEIKKKFTVHKTFDFFLNESSPESLAKSQGIAIFQLTSIFSDYDFDYVVILGDRFEMLSIVNEAIIFRKPIIHLHGGETTLGAIDEQIRHMITKASHIHFASCEKYKRNIINMGEESWRVYNTGALSSDNMIKCDKIPIDILLEKYKIPRDGKYILLTYHPVTLEKKISITEQMNNIFIALDKYDVIVIITAPNVDSGRDKIMDVINEKVNNNHKYYFIESLGMQNYFSFIPYCEFVIGNSSSGIGEVPFFKIPTVNIGDRQKGRIRHDSVIDVDYSEESINKGIEKAISPIFRNSLKNMKYKFGDGHAAEKMIKIIRKIKINEKLLQKKLIFSRSN